jgi:O-antigen ligase
MRTSMLAPRMITLHRRSAHESCDHVSMPLLLTTTAAIIAVLCFGPIAFGAVPEWAELVSRLGACSLLLLWGAHQISTAQLRLSWNSLYAPMLLFGAIVAVQLVFNRTAYAWATRQEFLRCLCFLIIFICVAEALQLVATVRLFMISATIFGSALALFASIQDFAGNGQLYWSIPQPVGAMFYGPYPNHSHYAGLMLMLWPIPMLMAVLGTHRAESRLMLASGAVLMIATIFLSRSRGGMISFAGQAILLTSVNVELRRRRAILATLAILVLAFVFIIWASMSPVAERLATLTHPDEVLKGNLRLMIAKDSMRIVGDHPLLGSGLGTFADVYPQYRTFYLVKYVNAAHNDYVQLLVETGLLGFLAMIWSVILLISRGTRHVWAKQPGPQSILGFAAFLGCTGILIHSLTDFNMHIPANAAWFFALAACASQPVDGTKSSQRHFPITAAETCQKV